MSVLQCALESRAGLVLLAVEGDLDLRVLAGRVVEQRPFVPAHPGLEAHALFLLVLQVTT